MPRRCSVTGCRSNYRRQAGKYVSCYGFPSDPKTLKKWLDAIGRQNFLPNYDAAVCAKHFDESSFLSEDMYRGADGELKVFKFAKPKLKIEAVPSLFLERRVERGREIERTDGCGVNEGVTMPLSTLINGFHHKTGAVLHSCEVLEVGDGKTCMDFVEVEMKDPENEEKPLNLDGSFCDSLDLRITNCGSGKRNGCLTNETVIRDGDGECLNNCGTLCDVSRSNLIGNRGFEKCRCDSAINRKLVHHQLVRGETDPDSGRFVKKVRGCGGQNSQNPSDQAADAKLDGAGTAGIMIDDGGLRRRTERNREVAIVQKRGNTGTLCGVLRAEKDVMSKKENCGISGQDVGNSMATSGNRSDSGETNDQTHADPETDLCYADLGSEEKVNKIEINCGGIRSRDNDSSGIFCDEIGGEKNSENKDTTHGEVNGNLAEIGVPLSQNRPCDVSNNDSDAKVDRGKNRGCTRNITKMQKAIFVQGNGYLVLNGSSSQRGSAMTNDQDFTVGSNPGLVKSTKKVQSCADNISCKNDSDGNFGGVLENGSREVVGQEHRNLVLINGNLSPNDGMKSGEVVSVKNVNKIHRECGDISSKNEFLVSGFGVITKNGSRIIPGLEKGSLIVDANSCSNDDVGSGQVVSLKNLKKTKRDFGETCCGSGFGSGTQNERRAVPAQANLCPNDDVQSEQVVSMKNLKKTQRDFGETRSGSDFGAVAKNEGRAIQGQENGDLVLMDVNLVPNDDVQSEQLVSMKTLKKPLRDFGETRSGSGFGAVTKNEMKAIPAQENGNSVLMDANLVPNNDVQSEQVVSTKTLKKTQRDFGGSGFGAVTKNERRAIPGQENGNSVLMDANLVPSDGMESVREPEVKVGGQIRGSGKTGEDEGPSEVQEWEGCAVKEELFRGLGLVPRGVLHDSSVDRRHCVTGPRRNESNRPKTAVFYPPGTAMFDTERFIGEIQRRPAIYDVRSKVYSNRVAKLKYWHEVGQEMYKGWDALDQMERRTLVKELQIKWKSIRDHFMRQLKQNMNGEGPKKKKYVHFDQLQFLTANLGVKRPRFKPAKQEPEEEYMELTPELPEERHFSFMTTVGRPDYDEHEVPVAANLLPQQPEDLSYHPKDLSYHHHKELSYHKELEGDRMGNRMFLLSLLPIMERLPDHSNIRARLQMMEVLQTFVAHEDTSHRDYYNYHDEKQSCGDVSQQHSTASHSDSDT